MKLIVIALALFAQSTFASPRRTDSDSDSIVKLSKRGTLIKQSSSVVLQPIPAGANSQDYIPSACTGSKFWDQGSSHCYLCDEFTWNYDSNNCKGCPKGQYFTGNSGQCLPCIDVNAVTCLPISGASSKCVSGTTVNSFGVCL